jgi:hypothetical protein
MCELFYTCYYDLKLVVSAVTFGELIVLLSFIDFTSDIYYILNEQFYNEYLFGFMVASLGISLLNFPRVLYNQQLAPAMIGKKIDQYFPGFNYISEELYFITYINGYIGIKGQKKFSPPSREDLENFDERKLRQILVLFKLSSSDGMEFNKKQIVDKLERYYASEEWNPLFINDEELYRAILYWLLVIFLYILQCLNCVLYILWPLIMFFRLPCVLCLMIFHSSTKLIFFKRSWNKIIYLWTLDENKLKPINDNHIDLELLHMVKEQEVLLEVGIQFVLQLVNAVLREQITDVYIVSVLGSAFDLASCVYRV